MTCYDVALNVFWSTCLRRANMKGEGGTLTDDKYINQLSCNDPRGNGQGPQEGGSCLKKIRIKGGL